MALANLHHLFSEAHVLTEVLSAWWYFHNELWKLGPASLSWPLINLTQGGHQFHLAKHLLPYCMLYVYWPESANMNYIRAIKLVQWNVVLERCLTFKVRFVNHVCNWRSCVLWCGLPSVWESYAAKLLCICTNITTGTLNWLFIGVYKGLRWFCEPTALSGTFKPRFIMIIVSQFR